MTLAFWCVFGAILLPYVCFGIAFPNRIQGLAWDAHLNSWLA
jgi:uncharacterized MAPEG superfamily protein